MEKAQSPTSLAWSVPVAVDDIPASGLHLAIEASPAIRAQVLALVAGLASVHELPRLSAVFDLTRRGAKVHVSGHVSAKVGQTCVVTLEPMSSEVEETVDVLFAPVAGQQPAPEFDGNLDAAKEPPEPLIDGKIDIGALATEFLVIGVDPHPRKPGVEFPPFKLGEDDAHPFAALEALKKGLGGDKP